MRIPRTRGAVSGALLIILGAWAAIGPLVGHYFNLVVGTDKAWDLTNGRIWLSVVPGVVVALGGLLLLLARTRPTGGFGAWLAILGGAWLVVGQVVSELWNHGVSQAGPALGSTGERVGAQLIYYYGLGALIVAIAAFALGRMAVRSVRDAEYAAAAAADDDDVVDSPRRTRESGRFDREPEPVAAGTTPATTDGEATTTAPADRTHTLTAADRVREAAQSSRGRGLFRRNR